MKVTIATLIMMILSNMGNVQANVNVNDISIYSRTTVVIEVDYEGDKVTVQDFNGETWEFHGTEDWYKDDICSLIMNDMGTDTIYDDEILFTHYDGWFDGWGEGF